MTASVISDSLIIQTRVVTVSFRGDAVSRPNSTAIRPDAFPDSGAECIPA